MTPRATISGIVLALNAADMIDDCLTSLRWANERIVLVDGATTDATAQRASAAGGRVYQRDFTSFADQRNAALALATTDWIMFVDADERVPPELADEIIAIVNQDPEHVGYWVPRRNIICGRWVKHAGWYPDRQLRLLHRGQAHYEVDVPVHEVATLDGTSGVLEQPLVHLNYRSLGEFWSRQRHYAQLAARGMLQRGEQPRWRSVLGQPAREFSRRYIEQAGFREGPLGLALCLMVALGTFETQARVMLRRV